MKFPELLIQAIQRSEIPLRFEPGAEEAVATPVTELVRAWLTSHRPGGTRSNSMTARKRSSISCWMNWRERATFPVNTYDQSAVEIPPRAALG